MLAPSIRAAGLDPDRLDESISAARAREQYGAAAGGPRRWSEIWSAGHSVSGVARLQTAREIIDQTRAEFEAAL